MTSRHVLFLCTGNSARSVIAEALLNDRGGNRFRGYSAGSHPKGDVHPLALELLARHHLPAEGLRSKSWDEFAEPGAPPLDIVITVCDRAAAETCPIWPGAPISAHWGVEDPAAVQGPEADRTRAFEQTFRELDARVRALTELPIDSMPRAAVEQEIRALGRRKDAQG